MKGSRLLRQFIKEAIGAHPTWPGDEDPRPTPHEKEFVNSSDRLAGFIVVRDCFDHTSIAHAPIYQTDGPDRPFLVRTTDTKWHIPFWIVRHIYPEVEDAFNDVDSKHDWRGMGPGDSGKTGQFKWEWVETEPVPEGHSSHKTPMGRMEITEEIGRNYHTVDPDPITWESFADYDIDGYMTPNNRYSVTVTYKKGDPEHEEVLVPPTTFKDEPEAKHRLRMVIDSHRVKAMNNTRG